MTARPRRCSLEGIRARPRMVRWVEQAALLPVPAADRGFGVEPVHRSTDDLSCGAPLTALVRVVLLCYYRDDRVMRSLGQEPRPPFPKGHVVEQGDWSLLDPVRARPPMYRVVE